MTIKCKDRNYPFPTYLPMLTLLTTVNMTINYNKVIFLFLVVVLKIYLYHISKNNCCSNLCHTFKSFSIFLI